MLVGQRSNPLWRCARNRGSGLPTSPPVHRPHRWRSQAQGRHRRARLLQPARFIDHIAGASRTDVNLRKIATVLGLFRQSAPDFLGNILGVIPLGAFLGEPIHARLRSVPIAASVHI